MSLKKGLALIIAVVMALGLLAGCGSQAPAYNAKAASDTTAAVAESKTEATAASNGSSQAKQKLTFWTLQQADINIEAAQKAAVKDFETANNCTIEVTSFPYVELQDKMLAAVAGGQGPDLLLLDQIWVPQYAAAKFVMPIDDRLGNSSIKADDYFPGAWGAGSYQGKTYGIPFDVGVWALMYYNKTMFKEAGLDPEKPPVTWDEFLKDGKQLTKNGKYGTAAWVGAGDATQCITDALVFSAGGKIVDDTGKKALLNSDAGVKGLDFWKACAQISPPGSVGRTEEDSFKLFTSGQVGMFFYGEWGQDTIKTRAPDMDYGVALLPKPDAGSTSVGTFGGFNIGINSKAQNPDLAWKFIEYATGKDAEMKITMLTPAHKEAAKAYLQQKRKFPDIIYQQLTTASYRPLVPNYPEVADVQRTASQKILLGQASTKDALDEAAKKVDELLNK
jgi:ABC-type glycerol-3-phosphate transport system substrate-binding protein